MKPKRGIPIWAVNLLLILIFQEQALSENGFLVLGGYNYASATAIRSFNNDLDAVGTGYLRIEGEISLTPRVSAVVVLDGHEADSFVTDPRGRIDLEISNISSSLMLRIHIASEGRLRGFFEFGPTANYIDIEASPSDLSRTINLINASPTKPGGSFSVGIRYRFGGRLAFESLAGYLVVPKHNGVDVSNIRIASGIGFVWE